MPFSVAYSSFRYLCICATISCLIFFSAQESEARSASADSEQNAGYQDYNRYIFSSNALGIPRGRFVYHNFQVLINSLTYGVTDRLSVSAGFFPGFLFHTETPVYLKPEYAIPLKSDLLSISGGFYLFSTFEMAADDFGGLAFSKLTVGNHRYNASLSMGFGFDSRGEISGQPIIGLNAHLRYIERIALITENYFIPGSRELTFFSIGHRLYPGRAALDFGLFIFPEYFGDRTTLFIPSLGVAIPF